jgi:hypothetical protein
MTKFGGLEQPGPPKQRRSETAATMIPGKKTAAAPGEPEATAVIFEQAT